MENQIAKTALITGASSGIGLELTRCFARDGKAFYRHKVLLNKI